MTAHDSEMLMQQAIAMSRQGIRSGQTPFGAIIADASGRVLAAAHNQVRLDCDATAHAEVIAIRLACHSVGDIHLAGCVMAATCEPCPMCAAAIHWARIETVYYGASIADATAAGFNELSLSCREVYERGRSEVKIVEGVLRDECRALFEEWMREGTGKPY